MYQIYTIYMEIDTDISPRCLGDISNLNVQNQIHNLTLACLSTVSFYGSTFPGSSHTKFAIPYFTLVVKVLKGVIIY